MKEAEFHQLPRKGAQTYSGYLLWIDTVGLEFIDVIHLYTIDPFHHQDRFGNIIPVNLGNVQLINIPEVVGELLDTASLDEHVNFLENSPLELPHQVRGRQDSAQLERLLYLVRQIVHQTNIFPHLLGYAGANDLDHHFLTAGQGSVMNLSHRSSGKRFPVECGENFRHRLL